jgi:hypothetical protein
MSMKNFDTIGNRNCDLPACSAVPQPTAPPCASYLGDTVGNFSESKRPGYEVDHWIPSILPALKNTRLPTSTDPCVFMV